MATHKGMRPQDVVVLLKLISLSASTAAQSSSFGQIHLAVSLGLSQSEVSGSLQRSRVAGLVSENKRDVYRQNFLEFLFYGLPYVFPAEPGAMVVGMPTAHSAPPLNNIIVSQEPYVWPDIEGTVRGQAVEPLYDKVPYAAKQDPRLYALLALADALRVGRAREKKIAQQKIKEYFDE